MKTTYTEQVLLAGFVLFASILPFSNRAVYMDEHLYLGLAQSALKNPLFPQDTPWLYFGTWFANAADHTHPPLGEYHLAALYKIVGHFSEVPFRILFGAPYAVIAVLGFYGLAARWVSHPFWVSLLFAACPPFFVMAPTLMMDLPSVGCLLMGLRIFLSAKNQIVPIAASLLLFTSALGMAYTAAIPLIALLVWCFRERKPLLTKMAVIVPFTALGLWLASMTVHFGEFPLKHTLAYTLSQFKPAHNLAAAMSFLGGLAVFPWSIAVLKKSSRAPMALCLICASLPVLSLPWPSTAARILYFALASWGAALIFKMASVGITQVRERSDWVALFFLAWFFLSFAFFIAAADMMTARYLLSYLPPAYLVLFKEASSTALKRAILPTLALSLCIAIADYRLVDGYRAWVVTNVPFLKASGYEIWSATESGLRFYLERYGARGLDSRDLRPRGTDLVIQHSNLFRYSLADGLATGLVEVKKYEIQDWFPLRTFNAAAGAGFHDSRVGLIPFTFSTTSLDAVEVAQVSPFASTLPVAASASAENIPIWTPQGVEMRQSAAQATFRIPSLRNVQWTGELIGSGMVEFGDQSLTLRLGNGAPAIWRNFRIVPKGF